MSIESNRYEMCFVGSGGQGVILASIIFAEAAVLDGRQAAQSQSYGPEARGGSCRAETIVSQSAIWFSKMRHPSFMLALTQSALDRYAGSVRPGGTLVMDDSLRVPAFLGPQVCVIRLPLLRAAREQAGNPMTANIVSVGAINAALRLFDDAVLEAAVRMHVPAGTEALNLRALAIGRALGERVQPEGAAV